MEENRALIIDMAKISYEGAWKEFGPARLKIRPYPMSHSDVMVRDGAVIISGQEASEMFDYCLTEWEGVSDAEKKPLKLTADIKRKIYDFKLGQVDGQTMSAFVLTEARKMTEEIGAGSKN